jgi:hypothetical protein
MAALILMLSLSAFSHVSQVVCSNVAKECPEVYMDVEKIVNDINKKYNCGADKTTVVVRDYRKVETGVAKKITSDKCAIRKTSEGCPEDMKHYAVYPGYHVCVHGEVFTSDFNCIGGEGNVCPESFTRAEELIGLVNGKYPFCEGEITTWQSEGITTTDKLDVDVIVREESFRTEKRMTSSNCKILAASKRCPDDTNPTVLSDDVFIPFSAYQLCIRKELKVKPKPKPTTKAKAPATKKVKKNSEK